MTIAELIKWVFRFGVCSLFVHRLVRQSNENGIGGIRNEMQTFGGLSTKNEKNYLTICTPERENEVYRIQLTVCTIGCVCVCANRWIHSLHLDHWFIDCRPAARSIPNYWNWLNGTIWLMNAAHILAASLKQPFSFQHSHKQSPGISFSEPEHFPLFFFSIIIEMFDSILCVNWISHHHFVVAAAVVVGFYALRCVYHSPYN